MFVSCMHPVAVLNAAFCMTCSLLMIVEYERGDHMAPNDTAYTRWSCHSGLANHVQIVATPPSPSNGGPITVLGNLAIRSRWMAGNAPHKSG